MHLTRRRPPSPRPAREKRNMAQYLCHFQNIETQLIVVVRELTVRNKIPVAIDIPKIPRAYLSEKNGTGKEIPVYNL